MTRHEARGVVASVVLIVSSLGARPLRAEPAPDDLARALAQVRGQSFRAHVEFLADDLLEGRETGTRGYDLAARYVASQLAALGIAPAGQDGGYFQPVPLREARLIEGRLSLKPDGGAEVALSPREDYLQSGDSVRTDSRVTAPVVFVGFGITAPELKHDDYSGLDVRGKIIAVLSDAPGRFPSEQRAHFSAWRLKAENAARRGAVGMLAFRTAEDESRPPWERILLNHDARTFRWLHADGTPEAGVPELKGSAFLSAAGARRLFAASPVPLERVFEQAAQGQPTRFALPVTATIVSRSEHRALASANVVGVLEGADPRLKHTYVVFTAHLDHVGLGTPVNGDRTYNGAYDNASGSAVVLEVARALASLRQRPLRSVLFVFVTAEEKGLLGSDYFAAHPTVPAGALVGDVNVDMPLFLSPLADVVAFGAENSSFDASVTQAARQLDLALSPDPMPEQHIFIRSDQYSFVRRGLPSVMMMPGLRAGQAAPESGAAFSEFIGTHYHMPSDDLARPMDLAAAERFIRANVLLGHAIASDPEPPRWKPGNFFGKTFAGDAVRR